MERIIKDKRGVFFTVIVLVILTLFLISFAFISNALEREAIQKRIQTMNNFLFSIEEDLERQIFISGFRIIFLFEKRMIETGVYITDIDSTFSEAFFDATINGYSDEEIVLVMDGVTFSGIQENINVKANKINVNVTMTDPVIEIYQEDPWNAKVKLSINFSMVDLNGLASWDKEQFIVATIPIGSFEDPTYPLEANDITKSNLFNQTVYSSFSTTTELEDHANKGLYLANIDAPSFLDRLAGDISATSSYGIESLAVPTLNSKAGVSIVDHEYYINTVGQTVPEMPAWFLIDTDHTSIYQVT